MVCDVRIVREPLQLIEHLAQLFIPGENASPALDVVHPRVQAREHCSQIVMLALQKRSCSWLFLSGVGQVRLHRVVHCLQPGRMVFG